MTPNPIRATGIQPCTSQRHPTPVDALHAIKSLRVLPRRKWVAVACPKCRQWHVVSAAHEGQE